MFLTFSNFAQEIRKVNTIDLIPIAERFGLDSALKVSGGFPIYIIDTTTALDLLRYVNTYVNYSKSEYFFTTMAHNWITPELKEKTFDLLNKEIIKGLKSKSTDHGNFPILDDKLLICIAKQKPDAVEDLLINYYEYWNKLADSIRLTYPRVIKRFFNSFSKGNPCVVSYEDCNMNCYNILWVLKSIQSNFYTQEKLDYNNSKLRKWQQNHDPLRFERKHYEIQERVLQLKNDYESISSLDFVNEPELDQLTRVMDSTKCWKFLLYNGKLGILDIGCSYGPLAGNGTTYKIELIDRNRIKIKIISGWIS